MAKRKEEENLESKGENLKYDLSKIDSAILLIKKELSDDTVIDVDSQTKIKRIKTKSPTLGYIFGSGGTPEGRIIELYGPESSGKTLIAQNIMADYQREGKFVAMIDAEFSFDSEYAMVQGLDVSPEKFRLFQPSCGEDAFTIVEKLAETGQISCITVDSIASLVPTAEMNGEMTDQQMGAQARMIGKGLRKVAGICAKNKCTLIMLNQIRMKIGGYGNPECVTPDTVVDLDFGKVTLEELFKAEAFDYASFDINQVKNIEDNDIFIKSFSHEDNCVEYRKVISLVRKEDSKVYRVIFGNNILKCTSNHRIFDIVKNNYVYVGDVFSGTTLNEFLEPVKFTIETTDEISPILDLEVEGNENYFSNGILSHNTTPGGNALKFWASIRCEVRKGEKNEGDENEDMVGIKAKVKNVKNKTSVPFRKGEIFISFKEGIDVYSEYIDFAVTMEIIKKGGAWYTLDNGKRAQGKANLTTLLKSDLNLFEKIKTQVDEKLAGDTSKKFVVDSEPEVVDLAELALGE